MKEAARVSRVGLLLGVINRLSLLGWRYRRSPSPIWDAARWYTPYELTALIHRSAGERVAEIAWSTTLWPVPWLKELPLPYGGFIGLAAGWKAAGD